MIGFLLFPEVRGRDLLFRLRRCGRRPAVPHSSECRPSWWSPHFLTREHRPNIHRPGGDFIQSNSAWHSPHIEIGILSHEWIFTRFGLAQAGLGFFAENVALYVVDPVGPDLALLIAGHRLVHKIRHFNYPFEDVATLLVTAGPQPQHALEEPLPDEAGVALVLAPRALQRLIDAARAKKRGDLNANIALVG